MISVFQLMLEPGHRPMLQFSHVVAVRICRTSVRWNRNRNIMLMCSPAGSGHGRAAGHWGRCWSRQRRTGSSGWWAPASSWLMLMFSAVDSLVSRNHSPHTHPTPLLFPQLVFWTPWHLWVWLLMDTASVTSSASSTRKLSAAGRYVHLVSRTFHQDEFDIFQERKKSSELPWNLSWLSQSLNQIESCIPEQVNFPPLFN